MLVWSIWDVIGMAIAILTLIVLLLGMLWLSVSLWVDKHRSKVRKRKEDRSKEREKK